MRPQILSLAALAVFATACAGRTPQLTQTVQPHDNGMSCTAIQAEIQSNNAQIADLSQEEGAKVAQNVAAGVAGVLIPVLWFGMDFQNAAGKEGASLSRRNQYLAALAAERCIQRTAAADTGTVTR